MRIAEVISVTVLMLMLPACGQESDSASMQVSEDVERDMGDGGTTLDGSDPGGAAPPPFADEEASFDTIEEMGAPPQQAGAEENARCMIETGGSRYDGPCVFDSERDGSFAVSRADESEIIPGRLFISVSIIQAGVAEVRGLTTDGINSRWGTAERSAEDRACWIGNDFRVCAY